MKNFTLLVVLFVFVTSYSFAQSIDILDSSGTVVNGQTVIANGTTSKSLYKYHLDVENTNSTSMDVKVTRYEMAIVSGTKNYFCWSVCYAEQPSGSQPVFTDFTPVTVPGNGTNDSDFVAYHKPEGNAGSSTYRFVFFDDNNPSDSSYVDIVFDIVVGMDEHKAEENDIMAYPNPAKEDLTVSYRLDQSGSDNEMVIMDLLGKEVFSKSISRSEGLIHLNAGEFDSGVYFYGIRTRGHMTNTKKLVINR